MLNMMNRLITVLALLGLIACAVLTAIGVYLPPSLRERAALTVSTFFELPATMAMSQRAIVFGVAVLVALIAFVLLVLELQPHKEADVVPVQASEGGTTSVARSAIHQRIQFAVDRLDDVIQVTPTVKGGGRGLIVHLDVTTAPYIDVPMKTEEIRAVTRDVLEKQMGLVLKKLTVTIDHEAYRELVGEAEVV